MDTLTAVWAFFANFPVELATQSLTVIIVINALMGVVIVSWRRAPVMQTPTQWTPLAIYAVAWLASLLAGLLGGGDAFGWLWVVFSLLTLASLVWSVVNLVRIVINK